MNIFNLYKTYLINDITKQPYIGLKFTAKQNNSSVSYTTTGQPNIDIKYSYNGNNWNDWNGANIYLNNNEFVFIKGNNPNGLNKSEYDRITFNMTGTISASGNINSLLDDNDGSTITTVPNYCYNYLFYNCPALISAPELPATTVSLASYYRMFALCTALIDASELPATILNTYCYTEMFRGCTALINAPSELPTITLAPNCYSGLFNGCSNLMTAPDILATELAGNCFSNMFINCQVLNNIKIHYTGDFAPSYFGYWVNNVSNNGNFYYNGSDTTRGLSAIPSGWTVHTF